MIFPKSMSREEILTILNAAAHLYKKDWEWCPLLYHEREVGGCFTSKTTPLGTSYSHFEAEAIAEKYQRLGIEKGRRINTAS